MQNPQAVKKMELRKKIKQQDVLQYELSSLKPKAKVYQQQQNSNILFLSGVQQEMQRAKKNMDNLLKEYEELDAVTGHTEEEAEGETREDTS